MDYSGLPARCSVRVLVVATVTVAALLLAACGGSSDTAGTAKPAAAGAKENATTGTDYNVCADWPNGTTLRPCAVDLKGPGGGRIFYDAGSPQPWGRFLEVAPQAWNGTLHECPGSGCGADSNLNVPKMTSDTNRMDKDDYSYRLCTMGSRWDGGAFGTAIAGPGGSTGTALGAGRANTAALLASPDCTVPTTDEDWMSASQKAAAYRACNGQVTDWFIPSKDELDLLCRYKGRNGIGGFASPSNDDSWQYISSSTQTDGTTKFWKIAFEDAGTCTASLGVRNYDGVQGVDDGVLTRPIRAF